MQCFYKTDGINDDTVCVFIAYIFTKIYVLFGLFKVGLGLGLLNLASPRP